MKRFLFVLAAFFLCFSAFGEDLKFAVGFVGGVKDSKQAITVSSSTGSVESTQDLNLATLGVFLDAQYLVLSVAGQKQLGKAKVSATASAQGYGSQTQSDEYDTQILSLDYSVFGKYPIKMGPVVFFPMVGVEYVPNLEIKNKSLATSEQKAELDDWFASVGCGLDVPLSSVLFVRAQGTYGFNLTTTIKSATEAADYYHLSLTTTGNSLAGSLALGFRL